MKIRILRQNSPTSEPYWQEFFYGRNDRQTIAGMLNDLNYKDDLKDATGNPAPRIKWECSCLQGVCGACAMVINGRPALACETFLSSIRGDVITLEPLRKFPTIADLIVSREVIMEGLTAVNAYIEEFSEADPKDYDHIYRSGKCLKCGLCLEVCPNYEGGKNFYGAAFANDCYLIAHRSRTREEDIRKSYGDHFAKGCSKAFSCMKVCPMHISIIRSVSRLNS